MQLIKTGYEQQERECCLQKSHNAARTRSLISTLIKVYEKLNLINFFFAAPLHTRWCFFHSLWEHFCFLLLLVIVPKWTFIAHSLHCSPLSPLFFHIRNEILWCLNEHRTQMMRRNCWLVSNFYFSRLNMSPRAGAISSLLIHFPYTFLLLFMCCNSPSSSREREITHTTHCKWWNISSAHFTYLFILAQIFKHIKKSFDSPPRVPVYDTHGKVA